LIGPGELIDVFEAKYLKKPLGRSVLEGSSQFVRPSGNPHQIALEQLAEDFAALHSAYRLNFGTQDRLAIGDDHEGFERRCRETCLDR
jgi:hypothetical protein